MEPRQQAALALGSFCFEGEIGDCRREQDLPAEARDYLAAVSDHLGIPVRLVGVGPGRDQVIWMGSDRQAAPLRSAARSA